MRELPTQIIAALAAFPDTDFVGRDICRRFSETQKAHVLHALQSLTRQGRINRQMKYGRYHYRANLDASK